MLVTSVEAVMAATFVILAEAVKAAMFVSCIYASVYTDLEQYASTYQWAQVGSPL